MYDLYETMAMITFVLGWYGVTLAGRLALKHCEKMRLVWCPALSTFSFVEPAQSMNNLHRSTVKNCLLWPEYGECSGRCLGRAAASSAASGARM
jgi:hypothetical protein